jgi:hypothetical protein
MEKTEKENTLLSSSALSKLAIIETCNTCNPFIKMSEIGRHRYVLVLLNQGKITRELYFRLQPNFSLLSIN